MGKNTPLGTFDLIPRQVISEGYGGEVLQFSHKDGIVYAIHKLWLLNPKEYRDKRIKSIDPKDRIITHGCINVTPAIYDKLKECCSNSKLLILRE